MHPFSKGAQLKWLQISSFLAASRAAQTVVVGVGVGVGGGGDDMEQITVHWLDRQQAPLALNLYWAVASAHSLPGRAHTVCGHKLSAVAAEQTMVVGAGIAVAVVVAGGDVVVQVFAQWLDRQQAPLALNLYRAAAHVHPVPKGRQRGCRHLPVTSASASEQQIPVLGSAGEAWQSVWQTPHEKSFSYGVQCNIGVALAAGSECFGMQYPTPVRQARHLPCVVVGFAVVAVVVVVAGCGGGGGDGVGLAVGAGLS